MTDDTRAAPSRTSHVQVRRLAHPAGHRLRRPRRRRDRAARPQRGRQDHHPQGDPRPRRRATGSDRVRRRTDRAGHDPSRSSGPASATSRRTERCSASLTVEENLRLAESRRRHRLRQRSHELFPELVARRKQRAGTLSGGQQQMVALARVLLRPTTCCCWSTSRPRAWRRSWSPRSATCWPGWPSGPRPAGRAEPAAGPADRGHRRRHRHRPGGAPWRRRLAARRRR